MSSLPGFGASPVWPFDLLDQIRSAVRAAFPKTCSLQVHATAIDLDHPDKLGQPRSPSVSFSIYAGTGNGTPLGTGTDVLNAHGYSILELLDRAIQQAQGHREVVYRSLDEGGPLFCRWEPVDMEPLLSIRAQLASAAPRVNVEEGLASTPGDGA